ncbi:MAG TPA: NAD(P)-dependent oxidoreductase, partial [Tichowtungia sp.]|nr:NAD(P)-dependent oxidoreductase [Tichowtungia sp.]
MTEPSPSKKMFPAALLLEGRPCLVVGGGRVAARKTAKLLEAGARITVVAPSIREQIKEMDGLILLERPFEEEDLQDAFIVFATTDNKPLNRQIIELCRERGRLCSSADSSWSDGDLIMPASFSDDGLTVAVSTGGRACRRSRLLRESLSRHIGFLEDVDLFAVGVDSTSGFQALEKLKTRRADIEQILPCVQGVHEFMILDTCNRLEIVGLISSHTDLKLFLPSFPLSVRGFDAFRRLALTASGLQSEIFGETRIVAQIKAALATAQEKGWGGSFLQGWIDHTLRISKEIRQAVEPHIPALEIEDLVFQWLEKCKAGQASSLSILLVGRGKVGQGLGEKLSGAVQIGGRDDEELRRHLPDADAVIYATGS